MTDTVISGIFAISGATIGAILPIILNRKDKVKKDEQITKLKKQNSLIEKQLELSQKVLPKDIEIIEDVDDVLQNRVLPILRDLAIKKQPINIINFGLDLYSVMPWLKNKILHPAEFDATLIEIKSLIINPNSEFIKNIVNGNSNISSEVIASSIKTAQSIEQLTDLYKFSFELRQYDLPPIYHGFILNDEHLFLGFTELENGKIIGGIKPYIHLIMDKNNYSDFTTHYFTFFKDWFFYYWNISKQVAYVKR